MHTSFYHAASRAVHYRMHYNNNGHLYGANAEEYYHVELVCNEDNGIEYEIQAYGEEAKELYNEINMFTTTTPSRYFYKEAEELVEKDNKQEEEEQEKFMLVKKAINCITDCSLKLAIY